MKYIPEEIIQEVLQRTDIVQVVSEYVLLKKHGRNYFGLCPFHQEKTPSFSVTPDKRIFYCFGCHAGGDAFKFLMLKEGISYPDAVALLAKKAGVEIPADFSQAESTEQKQKRRFYQINETATKFYHHLLLSKQGVLAREYLKKRGVSQEMVETFQIGYAPSDWDILTKYFVKKGCSSKELLQVGLACLNKQGTSYYDKFRNRIIFPITDSANRVVGFGGRILEQGSPKYLNTAETVLFNKRELLYGLNLAHKEINDSGYAVVMEGYMDVIAAKQHNINNAVASLGTALTKEQIKLLMRYTEEIVICYDADEAGIQATIRGLDLIQQVGCRVKVLQIPQGKDPDEYLHQVGENGWSQLVTSADDLIQYKLKICLKKGIPTSASEKMKILEYVMPNLINITNAIEQEESVKEVASTLNVSWETVNSEFKRYLAQKAKKLPFTDKYAKKTNNIKPIEPIDSIDSNHQPEYLLLGLILSDFNLFSIAKKEITAESLQNVQLKLIYKFLCEGGEDVQRNPAQLLNKLDEKGQMILSRLLSEKTPGENPVYIINDCLKIIKEQAEKKREEEIIFQLKRAEDDGDREQVVALLHQLQELHNKKNIVIS